ncbi:LysR family transcriptional regulator [Muricoccus radiodurans]|uniref:LysR family transcriptional regulator n=1 Tax=Muricoccus radiodurans TaxID=2231721 RepID=UPI003CF7B014
MDVSLRGLRAFVAIVRHRSFSRAAGLLNRTQPALTVQVRQLEEALGLRLLDRLPGGAEATAAGAELARQLEPVLRDLDDALDQARGTAARRSGTIRIAAVPSVASGRLPLAIARLRESHPALQVRLQEAVTGRVHSMVRGDAVEIGIASDPGTGSDLDGEFLFRDRLLAVMPAGHRLAVGPVALAEVAAEPLLLLETDTSVNRLLADAFAEQGLRLEAFQRAVHSATLINMARVGLGIALLPSTTIELKIAPELVLQPLRPDLTRDVVVVRRAGRSYSPAAEILVDTLRQVEPELKTSPGRLPSLRGGEDAREHGPPKRRPSEVP